MIDSRIYTFLEVCRTLNYTRASANLHITQPAVTQHIRYLEEFYGVPLVEMRGKKVFLTEQGKILERLAASMCADELQIQKVLQDSIRKKEKLVLGATLTVGEFVVPAVLGRYLEDYPDTDICVTVKNTENLLELLEAGEIEFAVVEGRFDKSVYSYHLISREKYIGVCGRNFYEKECNGGSIPMEALFQNRLIVREKGSGTRGILEQFLQTHNQSLDKFKNRIEVSNMAAIRKLVGGNCGISFLYETVVEQELKEGVLYEIPVEGFEIQREFNFVYLKNSIFSEKYDTISKYFQTWRGNI
ncbi:MAG: LysR family transcriptional regulator [Lachnospiraceae bacterium]|jgi:DNA-binding transcriptional LysR family regulator|nr:LysR family transcriptional regulator [Lachnospiraceae bacterium]